MAETTHTQTPKPESKEAAAKKPVFTPDKPEFPMAVYNHKTRETRTARDKEEKEKLAKDGFEEKSFGEPPETPDALTQAEVDQLKNLLAKAAKALAKLGHLSEQESKQEAAKQEGKPESAQPRK